MGIVHCEHNYRAYPNSQAFAGISYEIFKHRFTQRRNSVTERTVYKAIFYIPIVRL